MAGPAIAPADSAAVGHRKLDDRWAPLRARGVDVDFPFFLAPMVGLSHVALRTTVQRYLPRGAANLCFTEMLSTRRLPSEKVGARPETLRGREETALVAQIVGSDCAPVARSIERLTALAPRAIDINMGCPVAHAFEKDWGVALMGDPVRAEALVRTAVRSSPWPVSVKIRAGLRDDPAYLVDFARMLEAAGCAWITLHPRIAGEKRRGRARWDYIGRIRDAVSIPVIGNGDVQTADDALDLMRRTGCDAVMIGRAAVARPWIFWQIGERLDCPPPRQREGEEAPSESSGEVRELVRAIHAFLDAAETHFAPEDATKRISYYAGWVSPWLDFGHELHRRMRNAKDVAGARAVVQNFFSHPVRMSTRTSLLA